MPRTKTPNSEDSNDDELPQDASEDNSENGTNSAPYLGENKNINDEPHEVNETSTDGLVLVSKGEELIYINPDTLIAHKSVGWKEV